MSNVTYKVNVPSDLAQYIGPQVLREKIEDLVRSEIEGLGVFHPDLVKKLKVVKPRNGKGDE